MFSKLTIKDFIDELGSASPAPGGGSTAAFAASLGSALNSMVFNLTIGKRAFNEYSDELKKQIETQLKQSDKAKEEFLYLMDKDTEAFLTLMATFKLPKGSEEEKEIRLAKIQEGYKLALEVPLEIALKAYKIYDIIYAAGKYGNKNAISDVGVAALMTQSGIEAAILNVKINLSSIKDEDYKLKTIKKCRELVQNGIKRRDEILSIINNEIGF